MKISITLTHNKSDKQNAAQIENLKALLTEVTDGPFLNEETGETWTTTHHELNGLGFPHEVKIFQVVPFGVTPPDNRYDINSGGIVYYGKGDEDKTGSHPRFFNWGLKRGTDNGAEVVIHLEDVKKLVVEDLPFQLTQLADPQDTTELIDQPSGKISTLKLLKEVGQLDEAKTIVQAVTDLKGKLAGKGMTHG